MLSELQIDHTITDSSATSLTAAKIPNGTRRVPYFVDHFSFRTPEADREYGMAATPTDEESYQWAYMPDEVTRDLARHMHYAAFRWQESKTANQANRWRHHYYALRDRVILGNRKLIFRVIRQMTGAARASDDSIGDCDIVLIQAVAAYNPFLGVRFSTYAFTCLMRALARQRARLSRLPQGQPLSPATEDEYALAQFNELGLQGSGDPWRSLLRHFCKEDSLLSEREKTIIERRYQLTGQSESTLRQVASDLGISKERVRQLQDSAVRKLRGALVGQHEGGGRPNK